MVYVEIFPTKRGKSIILNGQRIKAYDIRTITHGQFRLLIACGNDGRNNQMRVTKSGRVCLPEDTVGAERPDDDMKLEALPRTNNIKSMMNISAAKNLVRSQMDYTAWSRMKMEIGRLHLRIQGSLTEQRRRRTYLSQRRESQLRNVLATTTRLSGKSGN